MARPQKDGMDYFPHDTDAVNDEKVEALRSLYGNDGYAFYFILLERIYRAPQAELDISDAETKQILAKKVSVTPEKFEQILATALKFGCFNKEAYDQRGVLTSNGIKKRANVVTEKRLKMRNQYRKQVSDAETPSETPQSKEKESKEKESKEKQEEVLGGNDLLEDEQAASSASAGNPFTLSPDLGQAYRMFEQEFGNALSPMQVETIKEFVNNYGLELLREAMRRAIAQGKRNMRYIRAILESWRGENLKTITEVLEYEQERERKKGNRQPSNGREPPNFQKSTNLKEKYKDIYL